MAKIADNTENNGSEDEDVGTGYGKLQLQCGQNAFYDAARSDSQDLSKGAELKPRLKVIMLLIAMMTSFTYGGTVNNTTDTRWVTEPSGIRDMDNGGNTVTGRLVGINSGLVDNFMVFGFGNLNPVTGTTVAGATVRIFVAQNFTNSSHGSVNDLINLHEMALPNAGWVEGTGVIGGGTNMTDDGSIGFANRVQFLSTTTTQVKQQSPFLESLECINQQPPLNGGWESMVSVFGVPRRGGRERTNAC